MLVLFYLNFKGALSTPINSSLLRSGYLAGHRANIYLAGRLLGSVTYNSSIKHTSCMKVSFWVS